MILIAPDKFKGTFTALQICEIVERRLRASGYDGDIVSRPMSDGGEGAHDSFMPDGIRLAPGIYQSPDGRRQLVVSSEIVGMANFSDGHTPLMHRSSIDLGRAITPGIPTYIAIGGTAISDGGAGFLQGLGVLFYDRDRKLITTPLTPATLFNIHSVDVSALSQFELHGIVDVKANLIEPPLSTLDFARQKSLPSEDLTRLKPALEHLRSVLGGRSQWDGAGGGLGYAISAVAAAQCLSGAETAVQLIESDIKKASLIITGEGRIDRQTVCGGKLVDAVWRTATRHGIPTLVLYGAKADIPFPYPDIAQIESNWEAKALALLKS